MDFFHGIPEQVGNTDLAAALCTLGIARDPERPLAVFEGEIRKVAFYFQGGTSCGTYETRKMVALWDDLQLYQKHPRHAMTYMRLALKNRSKLLHYAKGGCRLGLTQRAGGQMEIITLPPGEIQRTAPPAAPPDAATNPRLQTDDLELAAALLACGIPLWKDLPCERKGGRVTFFFHATDPTGAFHTRPLVMAWEDREWHTRNPEHPFAYVSCAIENRRRLMREIRDEVPVVTFERRGLPQFLTLNADAKTESLFMRELKKL